MQLTGDDMSIKCDFCSNNTLDTRNIVFISADSGIHICEECVRLAYNKVADAKNKKSFDQALAETKEKHSDVIDRLARHD